MTNPQPRYLSVVCLLATAAFAQSTGTISGTVKDQTGATLPDARVTVTHAISGFERTASTKDDGAFTLSNLPFQTYQLTVTRDGFSRVTRQVIVRSNIPLTEDVTLGLATVTEGAESVASIERQLIDTQQTGTRTELSQSFIERLPIGASSRGIESVLLTFPGFAQNANGAIHPRGAHNQMTFVVDGMPITDQLTGAFATSLDTNIVQNIELYTGDTPAEFGQRTAAVANVTTRTGLDSGRSLQGNLSVGASQFDTLNTTAQFTGGNDKAGYFLSVSNQKSNRFLDQVSIDNLHNGGNAQRIFARADYRATPRDMLRLNLMGGQSRFQLANLRSQHANRQDQRQQFRDWSASAGWLHTIDASTTFDTTLSYRTSVAWLFGSAFDTPVTADQARRLSTINLATRLSSVRGRHNLRLGFDYQHFPVSENFFFGITGPDFNHPASPTFNPALLPHDLTRNGRRFTFSESRSGRMPSTFFQDRIQLGPRIVISAGLRFDAYRFLVNDNQFQPRIGIAFHIPETSTVLRASYNRTLQTPPNENLLLSGSQAAAALAPPAVREALGTAVVQIRPERQNFFELGLQQALGRSMSINASYYHKYSSDQQDNDNFLNTGVILPITLQSIRVNGAELRLNLPEYKRFSATLSMTHYHAISTPPFSGGLFLGSTAIDALTAGPFVIDHDQTLGTQGNLNYTHPKGWWTSTAVRFDSGLVANRSDPAQVATDPDYFDLLPYVDLEGNPPRARPRTIVDWSAGYEHKRDNRRHWDLAFQLTNLTNRTALYNFQSIFVGTRLVQPRTAGVKLRWFF